MTFFMVFLIFLFFVGMFVIFSGFLAGYLFGLVRYHDISIVQKSDEVDHEVFSPAWTRDLFRPHL